MNHVHRFPILCLLFLITCCVGDFVGTDGSPGGLVGNPRRLRSAQGVDASANPPFECGERVLTLFLSPADAKNIRIYGPRHDQHQVGQLVAFCGASVKTSNTEVHLIFGYDSCYVKQEGAVYVLSFNWYGIDASLSCPVTVVPPSVTCTKNAMYLTIVGRGTADELSVAFKDEWAPLLFVATQCWHKEPSDQGELKFLVPHTSCGVNVRDGHIVLDVRLKDKLIPLICPYEPAALFPVKDSKSSTIVHQQFYTAKASEINPVQGFGQQAGNAESPVTPSLQPRGGWMRKMPTLPKISSLLPGSFNLAVNFPFSVPLPSRHAPYRHHFTKEPEFTTEAPMPDHTPEPTPTSEPTPSPEPDPTPEPTDQEQQDLSPGVQKWQELLLSGQQTPITKLPNPYPNMQFPYHLQNPLSLPEHQHGSVMVPGTAQYNSFESTHNVNSPTPHQHKVSDVLSSIAQYLPPGYFICSHDGQQPQVLPQKIPVSQHAPPLQYPSYPYQNAFQPSATAPPYDTSQHIPINLQSQEKPHSSYPSFQALRPLHPHNQKPIGQIQPASNSQSQYYHKPIGQIQPASNFQSQYYHKPIGQIEAASNSQTQYYHKPIGQIEPASNSQPQYYQKPIGQIQPASNPQTQYYQKPIGQIQPASNPQTQYYQKPIGQIEPASNPQTQYYQKPIGQIQPASNPQTQYYQKPIGQIQPASNPPLIASLQEVRPLMPSSSQTSQYVPYQTGRDHHLDLRQGFGAQVPGAQASSHWPHKQTSRFQYPLLRSEVHQHGTGSTSPTGFFQPRSFASGGLQVSEGSGSGPYESSPPAQKSPAPPQFFPVKGHAQRPYSQGPSFRYAVTPSGRSQKSSEPNNKRPQNDLVPKSYRHTGVVRGAVMSASEEEARLPRKTSLSTLIFYRPPGADASK